MRDSGPPIDLSQQLANIAELDSDLANLLTQHGPPEARQRPRGFAALLYIIVEQQVSVASGQAIWARVKGSGPLEPERYATLDDETLAGMGLSRPKIRYARALARAVLDRSLDVDAIEQMSDDEARAHMTQVLGIGDWTVDIYLLFSLARDDIWPVGDLAVREALREAKGLDERPDAVTMTAIAEPWRPWRSAAAHILWRHYRWLRAGSRR